MKGKVPRSAKKENQRSLTSSPPNQLMARYLSEALFQAMDPCGLLSLSLPVCLFPFHTDGASSKFSLQHDLSKKLGQVANGPFSRLSVHPVSPKVPPILKSSEAKRTWSAEGGTASCTEQPEVCSRVPLCVGTLFFVFSFLFPSDLAALAGRVGIPVGPGDEHYFVFNFKHHNLVRRKHPCLWHSSHS